MRTVTNTNVVSASLNKVKSSSRKMRRLVNLIRNKEIKNALEILSNINRSKRSIVLKKLLLSLLSNWKIKYGSSLKKKKENLFINSIIVNKNKILKRIRPAPQGKGHRIKKELISVVVTLCKK
ncbi:large ribosomal subunit protein uL22 [Blattabacterium cuenoti]|uniref:large ribosomal subunit protein uL22 n=1 Tax=Blattabacterium cuenoti TaxID=1653831 RepID=UPI00163D06F2|nr:uL22 family ribosomal protein [Blattabacterium cuenoti]